MACNDAMGGCSLEVTAATVVSKFAGVLSTVTTLNVAGRTSIIDVGAVLATTIRLFSSSRVGCRRTQVDAIPVQTQHAEQTH